MRAHVIGMLVIATIPGGCAMLPPPVPPSGLGARVGVEPRTEFNGSVAFPPGVSVQDGLTQDEAVAVALWNNPDFHLQLADLGFARADLLEAGLLRNPVLSLLLPLGPKQLEATLRWPIEALWERPRRVAMARVSHERVAATLELHGLTLVQDVTLAFIESALAQDRARLADQAAADLDRVSRITQARLDAGDISQLEARSAHIEAARAAQDAARARIDVSLRKTDLRARLGLALDAVEVTLMPDASLPTACGAEPALLAEALASRPDVRAAELAMEEAGRRLGWERSRVLAVTAALDANGSGSDGFEIGPGVDIGLPIFDRNQAGRARAAAEMERASRGYVAVRQRVASELRMATGQFKQARATLATWRDAILTPLEEQVRVASRAYADGEVSQLFVLDMTRRLTDARLTAREVEADMARALARTERAVGRRCGAAGREIARGF